MEHKVKVKIFGNMYNIQGDAEPEYIVKLAEYVNEKMQEVSQNLPSGNSLQIAILAALNIADEYFQLREIKSNLISDLERKTSALIHLLDEGLIGDVYSASYAQRDLVANKSVIRQNF